MLTAVSVARDCEMIDELDRIVIVSAKPPPPSPQLSQAPSIHTSPSNITSTAAGGDANWTNNVPITRDSNLASNRVSAVNLSPSTPFNPLLGDQHTMPLVEFHYAEDLHKPVTEVTATSGATSRSWREQHKRAISARAEKPKDRRWFRRRHQRSTL
ncbi:unnamed protein product [Echinostoma caproni]|uniref:BZIP domain-containing protein n=1 Tax=Echinostoma caproni TaxID=27848 RepID=A0A183BGH8_9TREM|nr:unnamed protein product [Echinostoma caproni]